MSDLRYDPVFDQWIAIARNRFGRPMELRQSEAVEQQILCPFCIGNEEETPKPRAVYSLDGSRADTDDEGSQWAVRVVPNKFPAFSNLAGCDQRPDPELSKTTSVGPYQLTLAAGDQEVIVCTPRHVNSLSDLHDNELQVCFAAMQDRIRAMEETVGVCHSMLFLNCGASAGASLSHLHAQLIGSPLASEELLSRIERNRIHRLEFGDSLIESCARWEVDQKRRLIYQSDHFSVFCPFASRVPFQVWLVPRHAQQKFSEAPVEMREELARSCRWLIEKMESMVEHPAYNMMLHQAPASQSQYDHWFFEIMPRLTHQAGYEQGTGIWVNPVSPETSARRLQLR